MLTASRARSLLMNLSVEQVRLVRQIEGEHIDDLTANALYLGNLCARGDMNQIKSFIRGTEIEEMREILNCAPEQQWYGTCLHMVMYWNTGAKALEMFELLVEHGAEYKRDSYGSFPWGQLGSIWITPVDNISLGPRNEDEFEETRATLREMYNLDDYEEGEFLLSVCNYRCAEDAAQDQFEMEIEFAPTPTTTPAAAMEVSL